MPLVFIFFFVTYFILLFFNLFSSFPLSLSLPPLHITPIYHPYFFSWTGVDFLELLPSLDKDLHLLLKTDFPKLIESQELAKEFANFLLSEGIIVQLDRNEEKKYKWPKKLGIIRVTPSPSPLPSISLLPLSISFHRSSLPSSFSLPLLLSFPQVLSFSS